MLEFLSYPRLVKLAPGASKRPNAARHHLLDSQDFLSQVGELGFAPVWGLQGSTHEDSDWQPTEGRHLIIAAKGREGDAYAPAFALINSHCKLLRVYAGSGLWDGEDFLLAKALPIQRWKGAERQIEALNASWDKVLKPTESPSARPQTRLAMAQAVAKGGYLERNRPSAVALMEAAADGRHGDTRVDWAFALVRAARKGNVAPANKAHRFVKGIRRPDAYWNIARAAYEAAKG